MVSLGDPKKLWTDIFQFSSSKDAPRELVNVTLEAILSAGSLHSPHLLQLSGIASSSVLGKFGIETLVDLPGVGYNLQDHAIAGTIAMGEYFLTLVWHLHGLRCFLQSTLILHSQRTSTTPHSMLSKARCTIVKGKASSKQS